MYFFKKHSLAPVRNRNWDFRKSETALIIPLAPLTSFTPNLCLGSASSLGEMSIHKLLGVFVNVNLGDFEGTKGVQNNTPICVHKEIYPKGATSEQKKGLQGHIAEEHSRRKEQCVHVQGSVKCHGMLGELQAIQGHCSMKWLESGGRGMSWWVGRGQSTDSFRSLAKECETDLCNRS